MEDIIQLKLNETNEIKQCFIFNFLIKFVPTFRQTYVPVPTWVQTISFDKILNKKTILTNSEIEHHRNILSNKTIDKGAALGTPCLHVF